MNTRYYENFPTAPLEEIFEFVAHVGLGTIADMKVCMDGSRIVEFSSGEDEPMLTLSVMMDIADFYETDISNIYFDAYGGRVVVSVLDCFSEAPFEISEDEDFMGLAGAAPFKEPTNCSCCGGCK